MAIRHSKYLPLIIFSSDILCLNAALCISHFMTFNTYWPGQSATIFIVIVNITWVFVSLITKNFQIKRPLALQDNVNIFLSALVYDLLLVFAIIYFFKIRDISRFEVIINYLIFFFIIIVQRSILFFCLDHFRKRGYNNREVLIIGDDNIANRLIRSFLNHPEFGYKIIDFIPERRLCDISEEHFLDIVSSKMPDEIFICYKKLDETLLKCLVSFGDEHYIKIKVVPDLLLNNNYAKLINYDDIPVLHFSTYPEISLRIRFLKRSFDILFALGVIVLGSPVFILLCVITKFTSYGPIFFKQERVGRERNPFKIFKFRTMYVDAEKAGPQLSSDNDPRITKWGLFMRKTRLDELPQFWNVLKGEMSVVGPRPEREYFIEQIIEQTPNYRKLFCIKPGLTSLGQVHYGYAQNIGEMCSRLRYDLIYFQNITFKTDLYIIYKTVKVMISRSGK